MGPHGWGHGNVLFGPGPGPRWMGMGGLGRVRRGHIRTLLLTTLDEGPGHGYELMQRLEERTGGMWRPSPGSVYPTLQQLEDEGLVRSEERDGKRVYEITEAGRAEAQARAERGGPAWAGDPEGRPGTAALREAVGQLHMAARQVAGAGQEEQVERAVAVLAEARKKLYQILAE
ncbi:MAG TPA: PadR family transcriptional regulator [Acidimicrobiales bacterium]|nr:PadR family transcriptional regulator [Acidimicrobiales bacterium]